MREGHDRRSLSDMNRLWLMQKVHAWCRLTDAGRLRLMSPRWCAYATSDVCKPLLMMPAIGRCCLVYMHKPRSMPLIQWSQARFYEFMPCYWCVSVSDEYRPSPSQWTHDRIVVCMPWMMLHVICWCHLADAHRSRSRMKALVSVASCWPKWLSTYTHSTFVLASLSRSHMPLADISFDMRTCHVGCMHALADGACHWPIFAYRSMQATDNACSPHPISTGYCVQATDDAGRIRLMLVDWFVQATNNVGRPHSTSIVQCVQDTDDAGIPCPSSTDRYVQEKGDEGRPHLMSIDHLVFDEGDVGRPRVTFVDHFVQAKGDAGRERMTSYNYSAATKGDAGSPRPRMT